VQGNFIFICFFHLFPLTFKRDNEELRGAKMSKVQIKVNDNGSLRVSGEVELLDGEGNVIQTKPAFSLCRCGLSKNKPFCDGSHKGVFQSEVRAQKEDE
jgi:CDGSH-type Zn-finger protein